MYQSQYAIGDEVTGLQRCIAGFKVGDGERTAFLHSWGLGGFGIMAVLWVVILIADASSFATWIGNCPFLDAGYA